MNANSNRRAHPPTMDWKAQKDIGTESTFMSLTRLSFIGNIAIFIFLYLFQIIKLDFLLWKTNQIFARNRFLSETETKSGFEYLFFKFSSFNLIFWGLKFCWRYAFGTFSRFNFTKCWNEMSIETRRWLWSPSSLKSSLAQIETIKLRVATPSSY